MADNSKGPYRKKALERITDPEQFGDYLKVINPEIWLIFGAILSLVIGLFIWGSTGNLENLEGGIAVVKDNTAVITVNNDNVEIESGMDVRVYEEVFTISSVSMNEYGRTVAYAPVSVPDGIYDVEIITESIHPIEFLLR